MSTKQPVFFSLLNLTLERYIYSRMPLSSLGCANELEHFSSKTLWSKNVPNLKPMIFVHQIVKAESKIESKTAKTWMILMCSDAILFDPKNHRTLQKREGLDVLFAGVV